MTDRHKFVIWKFPLQIVDRQMVDLRVGSRILSVQFQGDQLCLWATVQLHREIQPRPIYIVGTGHEFSDAPFDSFIGTVQQHGGSLVWHVWQGKKPHRQEEPANE